METRNILNSQGQVVGTLTLAEGLSEEVWAEKLAAFAVSPQELQNRVSAASIKERKQYAEDLLERFKKKNISEGINALQAIAMQGKVRALPVTFMGYSTQVDLLNCAISGDIEVAVLTLQYCTAIEDMSQPYHWLNQDRVNWLIADMKNFLGWA
jgi:hypothetical protein